MLKAGVMIDEPSATDPTPEAPSPEAAPSAETPAAANPEAEAPAPATATAIAEPPKEPPVATDVEEPEPPPPPSNKRWYVVKVQSGREESIKEAIERRVKIEGLEEYFGQLIIPVERVTEMRNGKRVVRERKL